MAEKGVKNKFFQPIFFVHIQEEIQQFLPTFHYMLQRYSGRGVKHPAQRIMNF